MGKTLLIVEDEETLRESLQRLFTREGLAVDTAASGEEAMEAYAEKSFDVVLSDIILPGMDGIEMMEAMRRQSSGQIFIVMTAYASLETAVRALRLGAYDYITKPVMHEEIKQVVRHALTQQRLYRENTLLRRQIKDYDFSDVIGENPALLAIVREVRKVADTRSTVLLLGETGTGKELFARVIHRNSSRRERPFVPINCSTIPEALLESELFGHARGAFTGAVASKSGLLEEAEGGTIFLDEIGDMPPALQAKLLRVLEDQEIRPVGSTKTKKIDIRLITATNKDLWEEVQHGEFREDLFYRVNVISLHLPPLRERKEDIAALAAHYLSRYVRELGREPKELSPEALSALAAYDWPGNVRELQNVLERAVLIAEGPAISKEHLPENVTGRGSFFDDSVTRELSIEGYTRAFIQNYQHLYSEQELAEKLGITRKTLWEKRKKWALKRPSPPEGGGRPPGGDGPGDGY
ncbi:MAG: sigma-54 dependent transcriptional regulator [Nitrospirota bacterium]|jgi:DNA-binding NtrC family response regulator